MACNGLGPHPKRLLPKDCATYNATTDTFQFDLKTSKSLAAGQYTISVEVSAPDGSGVVNTEPVQVTIRR